jgi:pSer/pThr/pTyr-binding forkhead associated (FHA) protein
MHCIIVKTDGLLLLRDLGSTNGTRVNGQRVRRAALLPNDQLNIANYKFRIFIGPDDAVAADPPSPEEHTQRISSDDVAALLRKAKDQKNNDEMADSAELPILPPQRNNLPDVYEGDKE